MTISKLELTEFVESSNHPFKFPIKRLSSVEVEKRNKVLKLVASDASSGTVLEVKKGAVSDVRTGGEVDDSVIDSGPGGEAVDRAILEGSLNEEHRKETSGPIDEEERPPTFELEMTVSSGTYVRCVVHDLGIAVGSAAHVVVLTRVQQGQFVLDSTRQQPSDSAPVAEDGAEALPKGLEGWPCVDWGILEKAALKWEADEEIEVDEDGWADWELEILNKWPEQKPS